VEEQKGKMSVQEAGRMGALKRKAAMSHEDYVAIGKIGGAVTVARHGYAHYSAIGKKGAQIQKERGMDYAAVSRKALAAKKKKQDATGI
jgi:uncharacterized protein